MPSGHSRIRLVDRHLRSWPMLVVGLLFLLHPGGLQAHSPASSQEESAGLDEHLGTRLPTDIVLRDEAGQTVRLQTLVTVPTIILPVYYGCTNVCVLLQEKMAGALPNLERRPMVDYRVISVSFDEQETPAMASRSKKLYLDTMKPPFPEAGWRFLTGDSANIHRLTDALGFNFQRQGHDFLHPVVSIVVAPDGTIVRYLYGTTILPKDLALALAEAQSGVSGASIRKLVEYCFTYDASANTYVFNLLRVSATVVILCAGGFLAFLILSGKQRTRRKSRDHESV